VTQKFRNVEEQRGTRLCAWINHQFVTYRGVWALLLLSDGRKETPSPGVTIALWLGLLVMVTAGELLPGSSTPMMALTNIGIGDRVMHFTAYGVLAVIPPLGLPVRTAVMCLGITQVTGVALEFAQAYVPGRSSDPYDVLANTAGVLSGVMVAAVIRSRCTHRHSGRDAVRRP
jgi:VanZ family protein